MNSLPPLIEAMTRPEFYPEPPASVELRQTHISWVLLAGERVYKLKKSVRLAFLDYSTLERRRFYCHEEVRLNRRLAPNLYLGVAAIVRRGMRFGLAREETGERVEEHAVEMRRVAEETLLERRVRDGRAGPDDIVRIAERLVRFHRRCPTDDAYRYGSAEAVEAMITENLDENTVFLGDTLTERALGALREAATTFLAGHRSLLEDRARSGRVCEGHGDLRAEHIAIGDEIAIFDCVEFSERLRTGDVASEVAFLAMDLDFLRAPGLASRLITEYAERAADDSLAALVPFYQAYRASVRGKVDSVKSREAEVPEEERARSRERARRYFRLARRYADGPRAPMLVVVCGLSGTGKSTVARMLEDLTGFEVIGSDVVRKSIAGVAPRERRSDDYGEGLYSREMTDRTYAGVAGRSASLLDRGRGAVVDATFQSAARRRLLLDVAARAGVSVLFVECLAPESEVRRRLSQREGRSGEASDATFATYLRQREKFTPLTEVSPDSVLRLDTTTAETAIADRLVERLDQRR